MTLFPMFSKLNKVYIFDCKYVEKVVQIHVIGMKIFDNKTTLDTRENLLKIETLK